MSRVVGLRLWRRGALGTTQSLLGPIPPVLPRSDHVSLKDRRTPTDAGYTNVWPPFKKYLDVTHHPDPESFIKPSIAVQKAPKSRIHDWGPTIADTRVHIVVMDDDGAQYLMQGTANGRQSIFDMMLDNNIPYTRRSPLCEPAGHYGEAGCYQCHIVFPKKLYDKTPVPIQAEWNILWELDLMGLYHPTSRLACQLPVTKVYDGVIALKPMRAPWFNWKTELYKPTNRMRGARGNADSSGFARSQRVTPQGELHTSGSGAEYQDVGSIPTFADTFWGRKPSDFLNAKREGKIIPSRPDTEVYNFGGGYPYGGWRPHITHQHPLYGYT